VGDADRDRWDERHLGAPPDEVALPAVFAGQTDLVPAAGHALELACGRGGASVWLAERGLDVLGVDVSHVAIEAARALAASRQATPRFEVADLDDGVPPGPPVDVLLCHRFRDPSLYPAMAERLALGGLLLVAVLAGEGRFRANPGELNNAFGELDIVDAGERDGAAWLVARRPEG